MKKIVFLIFLLMPCIFSCKEFPQADISNNVISAKIYLPDIHNGYYRGTRFDWSANMPELKYNGHNFFGQWFKDYEPTIHDAIMGPVEDFTPLDYSGEAGKSFMKIGVGILTKPDNEPYSFARLYPVIKYGEWKVKTDPDQVQFIHDLNDSLYSYHYEKSIQLIKDQPLMVLTHMLRNEGSRTIETSVYDHNLFVFDNQQTGSDFIVKFPFELSGEGHGFGEIAQMNGNTISFSRNLTEHEYVECEKITGFGTDASDYEIRIENKKTGTGVKITSDQPLMELAFWACSTTLCPEPYIKIKVEPGQEFRWKIGYEFYTLN